MPRTMTSKSERQELRKVAGRSGLGAEMADERDTVVRIDARHFRTVLGHYPTGVCIVTGGDVNGVASGLVVGSFTSVSLDPPLVAFFPHKSSTSWPQVRASGHFCVNVVGANQLDLCRRFARKGGDKFMGTSYRLSPRGMPVLDDVVACIECHIEDEIEAGDHSIVLGSVQHLQVESGKEPLLFFKGRYGRFVELD